MDDVKPKNMAFLPLVCRLAREGKNGRRIDQQPNGKPATIEFIDISGRTTAVVTELQKMPEGVAIKPKNTKGGKKRKGDDGDSVGQTSHSADTRVPPVLTDRTARLG